MDYESDNVITRVTSALLAVEITDNTHATTQEGQRAAAVLMPLVWREDWHVILTQRPEGLPRHSGEISFPGGRIEAGEDPLAAALRETREEIGVEEARVKPLGRLPSFDAVSGFRVTPYVGIVDPMAEIIPDSREVADVFEVPLAFLMNGDNHVPRPVTWKNRQFTMYDMPYEGADGVHRHIWGMTAMMMYRLWQRGFAEAT